MQYSDSSDFLHLILFVGIVHFNDSNILFLAEELVIDDLLFGSCFVVAEKYKLKYSIYYSSVC